MKIIVDAMGGDNAPLEIVRGALAANREHAVDIILVGRAAEVLKAVESCGEKSLPAGVEIKDAKEVMLGWLRSRSVTSRAKPWRSTARAPPASTRVASAHWRIRLPSRRSSSFKRPTAFSNWSDRRELEQHSSAK